MLQAATEQLAMESPLRVVRAVNWLSDALTDVSVVRHCTLSAWSIMQESCYFRVAALKGSLGVGAVGATLKKF